MRGLLDGKGNVCLRAVAMGLVALVLTGALGACSRRSLIYDVTVAPDAISPNADGEADAARIEYKLARNATLSIYVVDGKGQTHYFRRDRARSVPKVARRAVQTRVTESG